MLFVFGRGVGNNNNNNNNERFAVDTNEAVAIELKNLIACVIKEWIGTCSNTQTDRQTHTDRRTDRQTDTHTDRQTDRQSDRQTYIPSLRRPSSAAAAPGTSDDTKMPMMIFDPRMSVTFCKIKA